MILKITKGGGFRGTLNYLLREQKLERGMDREANSTLEKEEKGQEQERAEGHELSQNRMENGEAERGKEKEINAVEERQHGHKQARSKESLEKGEGHDSGERARIIGGNMSGRNARELAAEFKASRELKPRVGKAVYHASLSLPHAERLSDEKWLEVTDKLQREMGFERSQYVVIRHTDKTHDHVHVVASRIGMDGRVVSDSRDFARGERIVRSIEREYGLALQRSSHEVARRAPTRGEYERAMRTGEPSIKMRLQEYVDRAMENAPTASQFLERLERERVEVIPNLQSTGRVSGVSFRVDGELMKGSDLGRGYSWAGLEKRGMTYEHERDHAALSRAKEQAAVGHQRSEWKRGSSEREQLERRPAAKRAQRPEEHQQREQHINERRAVAERALLAVDGADGRNVERTQRVDREQSLNTDEPRHLAPTRGETFTRADRATGLVRDDAAIRSRSVSDGQSDRSDGALAHQSRGNAHGAADAAGRLGDGLDHARRPGQATLDLDHGGRGRDAGAPDGGATDERGHLRHGRDALGADTVSQHRLSDLRSTARDSGLSPVRESGLVDDRAKQQLADLHGRDDGRAEGATLNRDESEAGAARSGAGYEPDGSSRRRTADDERREQQQRPAERQFGNSATISASTTTERQATEQNAPALIPEQQRQSVTGDQLMRMMAEATRPVERREAREAMERRVAEEARLARETERAAREALARAKELAEQQAREQLLAKIRCEKARELANQEMGRELHMLMKERGAGVLHERETIKVLSEGFERTLVKEQTKLSELGHTKESLREQVKEYVDGVARDPESFTRRMEPVERLRQREPEVKERSRSIEHDRGGYGFSR